MEIEVINHTLRLVGIMDEQTSVAALCEAYKSAQVASQGNLVRCDFVGVRRANSLGMVRWNEFLSKIGEGIVYENAPQWLVEQFNFEVISLSNGSQVFSILAPFYCYLDGTHEVHCLEIGKDIPILDDYSQFRAHRTSRSGFILEPDFDSVEFLDFLRKPSMRGAA